MLVMVVCVIASRWIYLSTPLIRLFLLVLVLLLVFFFQAEDGIRDLYVTGVQTCALPIWKLIETAARVQALEKQKLVLDGEIQSLSAKYASMAATFAHDRVAVTRLLAVIERSEERRVGKECRSQWSP